MERTAIVSGGTGGLGGAVTQALVEDGWRVVVPYRDEKKLAGAPTHERLEYVAADLFETGGALDAVARAPGRLGALVNLVGGFSAPGRVHETSIEDFERQFRVNLRPAYLLCHAAIPRMLDDGGAIVCVSTRAAVRPFSGAAGYISSNAAVLAFVDALAAEYTNDGIRANAILPSVIDTPANRAAEPDADHSRWVAPAAIARVISFLCSDASQATSGAHIPVYGRA